jgi:hypothetical protein
VNRPVLWQHDNIPGRQPWLKSHLSLPGGSHSRGRNPTPRSSLAHARVCSCHPPFSVSSFFSFSANSPTRLSSRSPTVQLLDFTSQQPQADLDEDTTSVCAPFPVSVAADRPRTPRPFGLLGQSSSLVAQGRCRCPLQNPPRVLKHYLLPFSSTGRLSLCHQEGPHSPFSKANSSDHSRSPGQYFL